MERIIITSPLNVPPAWFVACGALKYTLAKNLLHRHTRQSFRTLNRKDAVSTIYYRTWYTRSISLSASYRNKTTPQLVIAYAWVIQSAGRGKAALLASVMCLSKIT